MLFMLAAVAAVACAFAMLMRMLRQHACDVPCVLTVLCMLTVLWRPCRYSAIMKQMLQQIEEFNKKNGRASGGGGLGGGLAGIAAGVIMGAMTGHGLAGAMGGAMSALAGGGIGGQTPQMSASEPFNLETQMVL